MSTAAPPDYTYKEFCDFARRFNQQELLTAVASTAVNLPATASDPRYRQTPPWALAAIAKASICQGNPYRSTHVRPSDLAMACHMHNHLSPEELEHPELNSAFSILTRTAYEQFPYQESIFEELARPLLFFDDYSGRKNLEVINADSLTGLIGAPLRTALGIALLLHTSARVNSGFFDPQWMDQPNFIEVLNVLPRQDVLAVINSVFANSFEEFKTQDAKAVEKLALRFLDRYAFNPLTARPLVRFADGRIMAPVPQLMPRKFSPLELYYAGIERLGEPFTRDMGELLEDYVGRQFSTLLDVNVLPEVTYRLRKNVLRSVDWILVFRDMLVLVLVEAKASRAAAGARAANETVQDAYTRVLGDAFRQINRTYKAIQDDVPEFSHVPRNRPIIGMVATLDPWYLANSLARPFLPPTDVPTVVSSVREVEHLTAIGQRRAASQVLAEITAVGDERRTWELGVALNNFHHDADRNPLLEQAWERLPFTNNETRR